MRYRILSVMILPLLLIMGVVSPSQAWGRFGFRGGFGGPRVGVYLGPWPYWYNDDPYYYDPYYAYANPYPYYDAPYATADPQPSQRYAEQEPSSAPDNSHHDLKAIRRALAKARDQANFSLDDGDITQAQHHAEIERLKGIAKEAQSAADANGGYLTGDEELGFLDEIRGIERPAVRRPVQENTVSPSESPRLSSRRDPGTILTLVKDLQDMLDKKLSGTAITEGQHDTMRKRLERIGKDAQSESSANGGYLTADQENALLLELDHAEEAIRNNFVLP